ncbi:putative methyltransferase chloroplastic, partial [Micractinium conductrix]
MRRGAQHARVQQAVGAAAAARTVVAAAAAAQVPEAAAAADAHASVTFDLACPICHTTPLRLRSAGGAPQGNTHCPRCARTFACGGNGAYADLTLTSGVQQAAYEQRFWGGTSIFQSPLVSFVYERGWRQGFAWAGFPGVDKEFDLAMDYLQPGYGHVLVDMSCGSGLFARRFLASNRFSGVVAADFSEAMLAQARAFFREDPSLDASRYLLLRADVGRLPFATGSVAALHAGAAIHCWPNPQAALAEISRVLRPGGVFVASTFLNAVAPLGQLVGDELVAPLSQFEPSPRAYKWWSEAELHDLCTSVGLADFRRARSNRFIMFAASKPGGGDATGGRRLLSGPSEDPTDFCSRQDRLGFFPDTGVGCKRFYRCEIVGAYSFRCPPPRFGT